MPASKTKKRSCKAIAEGIRAHAIPGVDVRPVYAGDVTVTLVAPSPLGRSVFRWKRVQAEAYLNWLDAGGHGAPNDPAFKATQRAAREAAEAEASKVYQVRDHPEGKGFMVWAIPILKPTDRRYLGTVYDDPEAAVAAFVLGRFSHLKRAKAAVLRAQDDFATAEAFRDQWSAEGKPVRGPKAPGA